MCLKQRKKINPATVPAEFRFNAPFKSRLVAAGLPCRPPTAEIGNPQNMIPETLVSDAHTGYRCSDRRGRVAGKDTFGRFGSAAASHPQVNDAQSTLHF